MTSEVGGTSTSDALARLGDRTAGMKPIQASEHQDRLKALTHEMATSRLDAIYLHGGSNLRYFTGTSWHPSERLVGAILTADNQLHYLSPHFELGTLERRMVIAGPVALWHEHESPYSLLCDTLRKLGLNSGRIGLDPSCPFFLTEGVRETIDENFVLIDAGAAIQECRGRKSGAEIALMQRAKDMTLEAHAAAAAILRPGIVTTEVEEFLNQAHQALGAPGGSNFCIALFGEATAYPHGVPHPQTLKEGDMVLIDTGCTLHGYQSDITRSYVFGEPTARHREVWNAEKEAQAAAFEAAQLGTPCCEVDAAARRSLEARGFGPEYALPGLPHRTGHGIGLDIHEGPYLVGSDRTPLAPGMCFSNEPMICVPGEFGVRLEDHFYMTDSGPRWFTLPSRSIDEPFLA
ncbi:MAG: Xaa-Pro peptidase family protein [Planctomycetes bacterium]|nr:Xaa-Pro peptidase family protein [Planctomycetota bacterium]